MKRARCGLILSAMLLAAAGPPGRVPLGQYAGWGAFADPAEGRCFAVEEPVSGRPKDARPALTVARWRRLEGGDQLHVVLSRSSPGGARLRVETRVFALDGTGNRVAARSGDMRAIVALMRGGGMAMIEGRDAARRRFRDYYPLEGAASAIDAMRLRCIAG